MKTVVAVVRIAGETVRVVAGNKSGGCGAGTIVYSVASSPSPIFNEILVKLATKYQVDISMPFRSRNTDLGFEKDGVRYMVVLTRLYPKDRLPSFVPTQETYQENGRPTARVVMRMQQQQHQREVIPFDMNAELPLDYYVQAQSFDVSPTPNEGSVVNPPTPDDT